MLPACVLAPPAPVVTTTLVPAFSAVWMLAVVTMAASFVLVKFGAAVTLVSAPASWIVMSLGSSSHVPPWPRAALALASIPDTSSQRPEVSTRPPSPPWAPPRAVRRPWARVVSLAHSTMLPPLPLDSASALMAESALMNVADAFCRVGLRP